MAQETSHRLPFLRFLAEPTVLVVWLVSALAVFSVLAVPPGSVVQVICVSVALLVAIFFVGYGFDIVEQTALGYAEAPSLNLSVLRLGPRLIRMLVYLSLVALMIRLTPEALRWLAVSTALAATPAVSSFIVFHEPMLNCLNPVRLWHFVSNMGWSYITVRLLSTSVLFLGLYLAAGEMLVMQSLSGLALTSLGYVLLVLLMCRVVGMLLHQRRHELGIRTHNSEEQHQQAEQAERRRQIDDGLREISRLCRSEGLKVAWPQLDEQMKRVGYRDDELYLEGLKELVDRRLLYRFASAYIGRRLNNEKSHVWHLLEELFEESGGRFQFHSGALVLDLVPTVESRRQRLILLNMLEAFDTSFPDHPRRKEALLRGVEQALVVDERARAELLYERAMRLPGPADDGLVEWCQRQIRP